MRDNLQDNQQFIDAAQERGEDTFMYMDQKSGECLLVSGAPESIRLLGQIVDGYELVCEIMEDVTNTLLRLHIDGATVSKPLLGANGEHKDA